MKKWLGCVLLAGILFFIASALISTEEVYCYDSLEAGIQDNILNADDEVLGRTKYQDLELVWVYEWFNGRWGYYCLIFENQENNYILKEQSQILVDEILTMIMPIEMCDGNSCKLRFGIRSGDDVEDALKEYSKISGKNGQFIMYHIGSAEE